MPAVMLEPLRGRQGMATQIISEAPMAEDDELVDIRRTFVESVCLECQLTIEQLEEIVTEPGFGAHGRMRDWRENVPPEIIEAWPCLSPDAMIIAFYMAHIQHLKEEVIP
jgi:hypothetical protein